MQRCRRLLISSGVVLGLLGSSLSVPAAAASPDDFEFTPSMTSSDNADGTYDVPLLKSDVPDVSVARVPADENDEGRDIYYMVSTTMHLSPGAPIMKSYDLVNWEIVNYAYDRLSIGDAFSLRNGQSSYGEAQWATSIRYHEGTTYVLFNTNNLNGAYMLYAQDPEEGPWERVEFGRAMHDPTLFFDDANGGEPYVFYGNGAQTAVKLDPNNNWEIIEEYPEIFKQSDYDAEWTKGLFEGSQLAYINGMYYMVMITSGSGWSRQVLVLRSPYLLGRYDERSNGENTYEDHPGLNSNGYAQGSLVEVDNGDGTTTWHGFFFRDTYPGGRIPALIPATWSEPGPEEDDDVTVSSENLLVNPSFDDCSIEGWQFEYTATLGIEEITENDCAMSVTNRVNNGSGPSQNISDKLTAGHKYEFSARFYYDSMASGAEALDSTEFQLLIKGPANVGGLDNGGLLKVAQTSATPGNWVEAIGEWTMPEELSSEDLKFVVETPWSSDQVSSDVNYLMDDAAIRKLNGSESSSGAGWPVFGRDGVVGYPDTFDHLITLSDEEGNLARAKAVVTSDDFNNDAGRQPWTYEYDRWESEGDEFEEIAYNGSDLRGQWQWNHAPDNRYWSLTDREGWLRLAAPSIVTGEASHRGGGDNAGGLTYLEEARNTLSQRIVVPRMSAETRLDFSNLNDGDTAGLAIYHRAFSYAAARNDSGQLTVGLVERTPQDVRSQYGDIDADQVEEFTTSVSVPDGQTDVYLRVETEGTDGQDLRAWWYYSWDGESWSALGGETASAFGSWQPTHFMAARVGLFNYSTKQIGGHAEFDYLYLSDADRTQPVSTERIESAIAYAESLDLRSGSCVLAEQVQFWLDEAKSTLESGVHTHTQADAAVERLQLSMAEFLAADDDNAESCDPPFIGALGVSSVVVGGDVRVSGSGAAGAVTVLIDGATVGSGVSDGSGDYSFVFTVPESVVPGSYVVTVSDETGASWTADLDVIAVDGEVDDGRAAITGSAVVGETLSASVAEWPADTEFTYQWLVSDDADPSNVTEIEGEDGSSLLLVEEDEGKWIGVRVSAEHPDLGSVRVVDSSLVGPVEGAADGGDADDGQDGDDGQDRDDDDTLPTTGGRYAVVAFFVLLLLIGGGALTITRVFDGPQARRDT